MTCQDCGPVFEAIHGTCPLCGQTLEYAWDPEDASDRYTPVYSKRCKRKGVKQ